MKSEKISYHKVPNPYNKPNKRVIWSLSKENTLVFTSRVLYPDISITVNPPSVNSSLTSKYMNPLNRGVLEALIALSPSFKSSSSCKTSVATQSAGVNMSSAGQSIDVIIQWS